MFNLHQSLVRLSLCLVLGLPQAQAQTPTQNYSLDDLFELALANNPNIEQGYLRAQQAQARLGETKAQQLPEVKLQSELSYAAMQMDDFGRTANQLQVTYPIYNPALKDSQAIAELGFRAQEQGYEVVQQNAFLELSKAYFDYWKNQAQQKFLNNEVGFLKETLAQLKNRMEVGYQGLEEVIELKARLAKMESEQLAIKARLGFNLNALEKLVGQSFDGGSLKAPSEALVSLSEKMISIDEHPSLRALDLQMQASQKALQKAKNQDGVQVELFGVVAYNESDDRFYDDMRGTRGGVRLEWPIYLGGATDYRIERAQVQTAMLSAQLKAQRLQLNNSLKDALLAVRSLQEQIVAVKKAYKAQTQVIKATKQAIFTGKKDFVDLIKVQRELNKIQRNLAILNADLGMQKIKLNWSVGQLTLNHKHS